MLPRRTDSRGEPNTDCVRHIQLSYGSLGVETIQAVAGPQNGLAVIHISDRRDDISSLSRGWMEAIQREHKEYSGLWTRETTLPMITLDALIAHYGQPEFIKVDVEGFDQKF